MYTGTRFPSRKNSFISFLLSTILMGFTFALALMLGFTMNAQESWAALPSSPILDHPLDGAALNDFRPVFDWNPGNAGSVGTEIYTIDNTGPSAPSQTAPPIDIPGPPPIDNTGPSAPSLIHPSNNGFTNDPRPFFDWSVATDPNGISGYTFEISSNPTLSEGIGSSFVTSISNNDITGSNPGFDDLPEPLIHGSRYYWHVRAIDALGNVGLYSQTFSFTLDRISPPTPSLISPANGAPVSDNTPTLDWSTVTDSISGITYELLVDNDNTFSSPLPTLVSNGLSEFTFLSQLSDGEYYWKVRAIDAAGNIGRYSTIFGFTIGTVPPDTTISSVIDGNNNHVTNNSTTASNSITFSFSGTPSSDTNFECSIDGSNFMVCFSQTQINNLTESLHTFRVRAVDAVGNVDQTPAEHRWTVDVTGPTITASPASGTFVVNQSVTLSSTATDLDAIYYTTDGSTPDNTDTEYTGPISISSTTTLKFIGYDTLGNAGTVGTETYTIVVTPSDIDTSLSLKLSTNIDIPHKLIPKSLHGLLDSAANIPITGGSKYTASGKLTDSVTNKPISGKTITITTDGSSPVTATTNDKGIFTVQLTAPNFPGKHDIVASFAGDTQYSSSNSPVRKLVVIGVSHLTLLTLKLDSNIIVAPGSSYSVSGKLLGMVGSVPLSGKTITITTDGSSPVSATTNNKGVFTVQLKAPVIPELHSIKAYFAGDSQYKPTESPIVKIFVKGNNPAIDKTASLDLRLEGKNKMTSDSTYTVTGKLIDALSKKPIPGKVISVKTNDGSPQVTDTTDKKGKFEVKLKAPGSSGEYDIKAYFAGDSQHKPAESQIAKITVEGNKLENKKSGATTDEQETDEQETDEQQSDEQQESEQETDEQETDEQESDEQQETDEQQESEQETDEQE